MKVSGKNPEPQPPAGKRYLSPGLICHRCSITLPARHFGLLKTWCQSLDITRSEMIRRLIDSYNADSRPASAGLPSSISAVA